MKIGTLILICVSLVILVIASAFYSGSEIVFNKVNKIRLERAAKRNKKARLAYELNQDYPTLIGTILVGNNLVNILASSLATILFTSLFPSDGATIATIVMTLVILIFGEILPKTLLSRNSFNAVKWMAKPLKIMEYIFFIIVWPVNKLVKLLAKLWTPKVAAPTATDEELITMVEEIEDAGYIDEDTADLAISAIDFLDTMAYEVITPRVDMYAIDIEDDINEYLGDEDFFTYSLIPVYEDTIDNIIGIVSTNQILKKHIAGENIVLKELLFKPIYAHKTKLISDILTEFKQKQVHVAIIIDEFGGTLGMLTMEDILEELVGDIWDETDVIEEEYKEVNDTTFYVDGDMNIFDMFELVNEEDEEFDSEYSTVAGWCTEVLEKFPEVGDKFTYKNLTITVLEVDGVRVEKVKVEKEKEEDE